jgi:hypothetical protein
LFDPFALGYAWFALEDETGLTEEEVSGWGPGEVAEGGEDVGPEDEAVEGVGWRGSVVCLAGG